MQNISETISSVSTLRSSDSKLLFVSHAAHVSVPAASLLLLQLFGTPSLWPFVVVSPLTVFGTNSKTFFYNLAFRLFNAPPPTPLADIVHFTNLLTYLLIINL